MQSVAAALNWNQGHIGFGPLTRQDARSFRLVSKTWNTAFNYVLTRVEPASASMQSTHNAARALGVVFPHLRALHLRGGLQRIDRPLPALSLPMTLTSLKFDLINGDEGLESLAQLTKLSQLSLSVRKGCIGLGFIKTITCLETLHVTGYHWRPSSMRSSPMIQFPSGLTSVLLSDIGTLGEAEILELSTITALSDLRLQTESLAYISSEALAYMFQQHTGLITLYLGRCYNDGADSHAIITSQDELMSCLPKSLTSLFYITSNVTDDGLQRLSQRHTALTRLSIIPGPHDSTFRNITDAGVVSLSNLQRLTDLEVSRIAAPGIEEAGMLALSTLTDLVRLNLNSSIYQPVFYFVGERLSSLQALRHLNLDGSWWVGLDGCMGGGTDSGMARTLPSLPALETLSLRDCPNFTPDGVGHLSSLTALTTLLLDVRGGVFTDESLNHLSPLTGLTALDLSGHFGLTDGCLEALAPLSRLMFLGIADIYGITHGGVNQMMNVWPALIVLNSDDLHLNDLELLDSYDPTRLPQYLDDGADRNLWNVSDPFWSTHLF